MNYPAPWRQLVGIAFLSAGLYYQFFILRHVAAIKKSRPSRAKDAVILMPHFPKWIGWFLMSLGGIEIVRCIWPEVF